jgi:hypothetical protein
MTVNRWWLAHRTVQQLYAALRQLQTLLYGAAGLATVNLTIFAKHGFLNQIFSLSTTIPFLKLLAPFIAQLSFLLNLGYCWDLPGSLLPALSVHSFGCRPVVVQLWR